MLKGGEEFLGTFRAEQPKPLIVEAFSGLIENEDGTENYRIAALIDITDRVRAEREEYARQIRDKGQAAGGFQLMIVPVFQARNRVFGEEFRGDAFAGYFPGRRLGAAERTKDPLTAVFGACEEKLGDGQH
jgi:hypothetical protein